MSLNKVFTLIYIAVCLVISFPFNYSNFQLLYQEDGIPAGADAAFHTYSVLKLLDTGDPLITYSAFPSLVENSSSYYPSLMHLIHAGIVKIVSFNFNPLADAKLVIEVIKAFMLAVSFAGTIGFALVIKTLLEKGISIKINFYEQSSSNKRYQTILLSVSMLAFSIFIFSLSPIVKTYNDGTYAQITAMWLFFPYYLYFLINRHWIVSGILLGVISSTHNLAFIMSLSATLPYIISLLIQRIRRLKLDLIKFVTIFIIVAIPSLILFHIPSALYVLDGEAAETVYTPWPLDIVIQQITPGLYYGGTFAVALCLILNYKTWGWITGWALIYLVVFSLSSTLGERFARELAVVFGLVVGICVAYLSIMFILSGLVWLKQPIVNLKSQFASPRKILLSVIVISSMILVPYAYFHDRFQDESNPIIVKYFTEAFEKSNLFLLAESNHTGNNSVLKDEEVIVLFGENPWLKVTTYGKFDVLSVSQDTPGSMGEGDRQINSELNRLLLKPLENETACIVKKYNVEFLFISDQINGRWYHPQSENYYKEMSLLSNDYFIPLYDLKANFSGSSDERLRIYSPQIEKVNQTCDS
jgi:hypothetical protein